MHSTDKLFKFLRANANSSDWDSFEQYEHGHETATKTAITSMQAAEQRLAGVSLASADLFAAWTSLTSVRGLVMARVSIG